MWHFESEICCVITLSRTQKNVVLGRKLNIDGIPFWVSVETISRTNWKVPKQLDLMS